MKKFLFSCLLLTGTYSFAQLRTAPNKLNINEARDGWKLLFDGRTTSGWHTYNQTTAGAAWKASGGALYLDTSSKKDGQIVGGGDLVTDKSYTNFHLKYEWKISAGGNSGVMFFVKEDPKYGAAYYTGPEMQVLDNEGHPDGKITKHRSGDLYDLIKCSEETVKPVGDWNQAEIIMADGKLSLILNGVLVVSTTMWDDAWKKMVAASKFKAWPDFGVFHSGKIDLQDHGHAVWFRNIKIKEF